MADNEVQTKFGAQIDGLVAGVNTVKEQVESLTGPIEAANAAFASLGEAAVAGLALDKIYDYQKELASLGEEIERTASLTGLSTDQVQQFQFAVKMTGGDAETAGASLLLLERNIAEAQSGSGRAYQAFVNLGVSLDDLKTKSPNDILAIMAQRFSETGDDAQQAAIKIDYMRTVAGRAGTNLIPLLNQGPEGLKKLNEVLDSTNSKLSPGMVEALAEAKRTSLEADAAWKGFYQTIGSVGFFDTVNRDMIDLAHAATAVAKAVQQASRELDNLITSQADRLPTEAEEFTAAANKFKAAMTARGGKPEVYGPPAPAPKAGNPLPALPTGAGGGDDGDKTQDQIDRSNYQTSLEVDKLRLEGRKEIDQAMVDSGQITAAQQIADLQQMATQEYAIELQAIDRLASTYDNDSAEYAELQNKKLVLAQQFANEQAKLTEQQAANQKKRYEAELAPWKQLMGDMGSAADTMINGVLSGTQTFKQALSKTFDDLGIKFSEVMAKMLAEFAVFEATSGKGFLGFGSSNPFAALSTAFTQVTTEMSTSWAATQAKNLISAQTTDTAIVGANAAANAAIAASNTAGAAVSNGPAAAAAKANISTQAASAAASVYADVAAIPYVGWVLAPPAAAAAFAAVEAFGGGIASYDVGSWNIPSDQVAMVHAGEMIIPAAQAAAIRGGGASIGGGSVGGGSQGFTININAIDTQTGAQFLKNNASVIASTLSGQMRNLNPRLQS